MNDLHDIITNIYGLFVLCRALSTTTMRSHYLILVVWMYWIGLVYSQDNQHPEFPVDPETNVCDIFNEDGQTRNMCLKSEFPEETVDDRYDSKVSQCCNGHGFVFTDECNVSQLDLYGYWTLFTIYFCPVGLTCNFFSHLIKIKKCFERKLTFYTNS